MTQKRSQNKDIESTYEDKVKDPQTRARQDDSSTRQEKTIEGEVRLSKNKRIILYIETCLVL